MTNPIQVSNLQTALENQEFEFHYQPQVSLSTGEISGAEALIRWRKPDGEIVPAGDFIPLAEKSGFIKEITFNLFEKFIQDATLIQDLNTDMVLSMNFSTLDLDSPKLLPHIADILHQSNIRRQNIAIEITESAVTKLLNDKIYYHLKDLQIPLIMDDFGSGFANLASLVDIPFSKIKLDRTLIDQVLQDKKRYVVVKDSIRLAHRLGMEVITEGVEDPAVYQFLQSIGCTSAQGHLIAKPMPLKEFMRYLTIYKATWNGTPAGLLHLAQLDHIEWRKELIDAAFRFNPAKDEKSDLFKDSFIDANQCLLGHWYHGDGQIFSGLEEFQKLDEAHHETHLLAHRLIHEATKKGRSTDEMLAISRKITATSLEILTLLHSLEHRVLEANYQLDP